MVYDRKRTVSGSTRAGLCFYLIGSGSSTDGRIRQKSGWENTTEERMENTTETRMGGMDMSDKKMNAESLRGTVRVLLSAVCFSTGGVLIKSIPWSSVTIQGARSIFSVLVVGCYMLLRRQKFVWNKTVLFGAVCNTVMAFAFVAADQAHDGCQCDRAAVHRAGVCHSPDVADLS